VTLSYLWASAGAGLVVGAVVRLAYVALYSIGRGK